MSPNPTRVRPAPVPEQLPDYVRETIAELKPSRFFTLTSRGVVEYLAQKNIGVTVSRMRVIAAIKSGELRSKLDGTRKRVSQYDALIWVLNDRHVTYKDAVEK